VKLNAAAEAEAVFKKARRDVEGDMVALFWSAAIHRRFLGVFSGRDKRGGSGEIGLPWRQLGKRR